MSRNTRQAASNVSSGVTAAAGAAAATGGTVCAWAGIAVSDSASPQNSPRNMPVILSIVLGNPDDFHANAHRMWCGGKGIRRLKDSRDSEMLRNPTDTGRDSGRSVRREEPRR